MIIKKIQPTDTYKLRLKVLKTCDDYIYKYQGDFDDDTSHFGAFENDINIGIVSLMTQKNPLFKGKQMQLRGMAVLDNLQSRGVGKRLVDEVIVESKKYQTDIIWCNAREHVVDFYKKQGFKISGERFYIEHVCYHYIMYLNLKPRFDI
jgi:predicted GNAT family N-acyltransferase